MYAWMHDFVQNNEISMRSKDSMNACYVMYYKRFMDAWILIRNAYDALWSENIVKKKGLVINKIG